MFQDNIQYITVGRAHQALLEQMFQENIQYILSWQVELPGPLFKQAKSNPN